MTVTLSSLSPMSGSPASIKREIILPSTETMLPPTMTLASSGTTAPATGKSASKAKSRKRVNTAEKRHQHNAIERQRRETLNGKFLSLARLLPALASSRRPSKSAIVNGSIAHLTYQRDQRLLASKLLRRLAGQYDALLSEVNEWRKNSGYAPKESAASWTDEMEEVCGVEKEVFGHFAGFDDGDADDNDNDNEDADDMASSIAADPALEAANNIAANFSNGLITPRHSTELDAITHAQALFGSSAAAATAAGLMSSTLHPQADSRRAATVNGFNWSHDFGFSPASAPSTSSLSSALGASISSASSSSASLPFSAFMSDANLDVSSSGSPSNSTQGGHVLTPLGDQLLYDHTPSPSSSSGVAHSASDGERAAGSAAWTDNFVMMQQIQQAQLRHQQQQQQASLAAAAAQVHAYTASGNVAMATSMFNAMFPPGQSPPPLPSLQQQQQQMQQQQQRTSAGTPDAFTQSMLAGVFPQHGVSGDQIEAWRKAALALSLSQQQQQQQQQQSQAQSSQPAGLRDIGRSHSVQGVSPSGLWDPRV